MQTYTFTIRGDPAQKLQRIKALAAQKGVSFNGDLNRGNFAGGISLLGMGIRGTYAIQGNMIAVTVIEKPASYSWDQIESQLRGFIEG
jgi:hypothetical protein